MKLNPPLSPRPPAAPFRGAFPVLLAAGLLFGAPAILPAQEGAAPQASPPATSPEGGSQNASSPEGGARTAAPLRLEDLAFSAQKGKEALRLSFAADRKGKKGGKASKGAALPPYFQKYDPGAKRFLVSFLDMENTLPLGRQNLVAGSLVEGVWLKRMKSPSGRSFLGVEVVFRELPPGEPQVVLQGKDQVRLEWKVAAPAPAAVAEKAPVAPAPAAASEKAPAIAAAPRESSAPVASGPAAKPAPSAPAEPVATTAAAAKIEAAPKTELEAAPKTEAPAAELADLREVTLTATPSQEEIVFRFEPGITPDFTRLASSDKKTLRIAVKGAGSRLTAKKWTPPGAGLFGAVSTSLEPPKGGKAAKGMAKGRGLYVTVTLKEGLPVQMSAEPGKLVLTGPGGTEPRALTWSSANPGSQPLALAAKPEPPLPSAHALGSKAETADPAAPSSLSLFTPSGKGKPLVLVRDSVALLDSAPARAGKKASRPAASEGASRKLPLGASVRRVGRQGAFLQVEYEGQVGFIPQAAALYPDAMTAAQKKSLEKSLAQKRDREEKQRLAAAAAAEKAAQVAAEGEAAARKAETEAAALAAKAQEEAQAAAAKASPGPAGSAGSAASAASAGSAGPNAAAPVTPTPGAPSAPAALAGAPAGGAGTAPAPNPGAPLASGKPGVPNDSAFAALAPGAAEGGPKLAVPPRVAYNSFGRRDPFIPVEQGVSENGIEIDQMKVVGIVWESREPMAVLEHIKEAGVSFTVRQGDPVHNGRVARITRDMVTFELSEYGISRSYSLRLVSSERVKK